MDKKSTTSKSTKTKDAVKKPNSISSAVKATFGVGILIILLLGATIAILAGQNPRVVANYKQCKAAGGVVQGNICEINDVKFTSESGNDTGMKRHSKDRSKEKEEHPTSNEYVGLTEEQAIGKAHSAGVRIRVIERDGQPLPMTMDFIKGRVNLSIENGKVVEANIEGEES